MKYSAKNQWFLTLISFFMIGHLWAQSPRIVNIINFIRQTEPRVDAITDEVLYQTVVSQAQCLKAHNLKGTYLLQYDALINHQYQTLMKDEEQRGCEIGGWWEITEPHVKAAGMKWRGRYPWDWHTNVGFAVGYTPQEREKLVDVYMEEFKSIFGHYPASIGSWFIDAHTLGYLYDKYHIEASCLCRDQVGTDGYTLWGGYWEGGYYPSRKNAYMPAQTKKGQIAVPTFRMLGSDPIYQYDAGVGGAVQSVATLEPVYTEGGGSPQWVDWFFKIFTEDPALGFQYVQAGQENSFTWEAMKNGFKYQMQKIEQLLKERKIIVQTLQETGRWYAGRYKVTPATSLSALTDNSGKGKKTVWFNSRYYRSNLLWDNARMSIRDVHLFDETCQSAYLTTPTTSTQCLYETLPFVDGCLWSTNEERAAMQLYLKGSNGTWEPAEGLEPQIKEQGKTLSVVWPLKNNRGKFLLTMKENLLEVATNGLFAEWQLRLTTEPHAQLPFTTIQPQEIQAQQKGFSYKIRLKRGEFVDLRNLGKGQVFSILPQKGRIIINLNTTK